MSGSGSPNAVPLPELTSARSDPDRARPTLIDEPEADIPAQGSVVQGVFDRIRSETHGAIRTRNVGAVVQKISARSHHKHLTRCNTSAFAQVKAVELRGLEPLTL
jgi:hypothetical protein